MRKLRILPVLLVVLLSSACGKQLKPLLEPCGFKIQVDEVQGTKVKFTVLPDDPSACYALSLVQDSDETDWKIARDILRWNGQAYEFYKEMNSVADYADVFCYMGERTIPSNLQASYFWEYEIEDERFYDRYFGSFFTFFYEIMDLYAGYGFMEKMTDRGVSEWNFVRDDPSVKPGERYTLAISGVQDGEINSEITYIDFIFQKGNIELLPHEKEE